MTWRILSDTINTFGVVGVGLFLLFGFLQPRRAAIVWTIGLTLVVIIAIPTVLGILAGQAIMIAGGGR